MSGVYHLMASLLYGSGLRLTECLNLRVKDIDFGYQQITDKGWCWVSLRSTQPTF